jgi:hypothetical protein
MWYISLVCATATVGAEMDAQCSYDRENDQKAVGAATHSRDSSNIKLNNIELRGL